MDAPGRGPKESDALLDELLDASISEERRLEIESLLRSSSYGQKLLRMHELLRGSGAESWKTDLTSVIAEHLPGGSPQLYLAVAELVVRAWADLDFRNQLRAAPRTALAREDIQIPHEVDVRVVEVHEASLPTASSLALPLPPPGSPAIEAAAARQRLMSTDYAWFWGIPGRPDREHRDAVEPPLANLRRRAGQYWEQITSIAAPPAKLAYAAAVLGVVAIGFYLTRVHEPGPQWAGQAGGEGTLVVVVIGVLAAVLAALALRTRG